MLVALNALSGKDTNCKNVMDGYGVIIEGIYQSRRFAFQSWNPDACDNPDSKELTKILEFLGEKYF